MATDSEEHTVSQVTFATVVPDGYQFVAYDDLQVCQSPGAPPACNSLTLKDIGLSSVPGSASVSDGTYALAGGNQGGDIFARCARDRADILFDGGCEPVYRAATPQRMQPSMFEWHTVGSEKRSPAGSTTCVRHVALSDTPSVLSGNPR